MMSDFAIDSSDQYEPGDSFEAPQVLGIYSSKSYFIHLNINFQNTEQFEAIFKSADKEPHFNLLMHEMSHYLQMTTTTYGMQITKLYDLRLYHLHMLLDIVRRNYSGSPITYLRQKKERLPHTVVVQKFIYDFITSLLNFLLTGQNIPQSICKKLKIKSQGSTHGIIPILEGLSKTFEFQSAFYNYSRPESVIEERLQAIKANDKLVVYYELIDLFFRKVHAPGGYELFCMICYTVLMRGILPKFEYLVDGNVLAPFLASNTPIEIRNPYEDVRNIIETFEETSITPPKFDPPVNETVPQFVAQLYNYQYSDTFQLQQKLDYINRIGDTILDVYHDAYFQIMTNPATDPQYIQEFKQWIAPMHLSHRASLNLEFHKSAGTSFFLLLHNRTMIENIFKASAPSISFLDHWYFLNTQFLDFQRVVFHDIADQLLSKQYGTFICPFKKHHIKCSFKGHDYCDFQEFTPAHIEPCMVNETIIVYNSRYKVLKNPQSFIQAYEEAEAKMRSSNEYQPQSEYVHRLLESTGLFKAALEHFRNKEKDEPVSE